MSEEDTIQETKDDDDELAYYNILYENLLNQTILNVGFVACSLLLMAKAGQCKKFKGLMYHRAEVFSNAAVFLYLFTPVYKLSKGGYEIATSKDTAGGVAFLRSKSAKFALLALFYTMLMFAAIHVLHSSEFQHVAPFFYWYGILHIIKIIWSMAFRLSRQNAFAGRKHLAHASIA